jgi:predicted nucleotidyltransferase
MITEKQLNIFQVFAMQPFAEYTLKQIKDRAKEKSNNALEIAMRKFKEEKLFTEKRVGKSTLYALDFANDKVYYYIALANHERLANLAQKSIHLVAEDANSVTKFLAIIVFGTYAEGKETKKSDLDIAIIIEDERHKKKIQTSLRNSELKSLIPLDCHVLTRNEFIEMLTNDEENLGKQIARKHLATHNHQLFYGLVLEGMKRGFRL